MTSYLIRRIIQAILTLYIAVTVAFLLGRATGKPAALILTEGATPQQIHDLNEALGFNDPLAGQYVNYLVGLFRGDFGLSYRNPGRGAIEIILDRLPATMTLALTSFLIGLLLAVVAAVLIHITGSRTLRALFVWSGSLRQSLPDFFFGVVIVLIFSVALGWLPSLGYSGTASLVLPVATIATAQFVLYVRLLDSALSEQSTEDYVRTAYARGKGHAMVVATEMLPNAFLPVLTVAGLNLASLLGGTIIVEQVFAWPGVGGALIGAVSQRDFAVVQAGLLVVAFIFVVVNVLVDVLSAVIDPRVKLS
ncbi:ABC transporter permease [Paramicrobacterium chengjingii]|uniref:ABC transporter permease n=1 Tax=Paramicrobacterium chengjingii TaxID=2769067 RepID=A0ABX6YH12_9MICO|nr:ABC transporter permease [Microbacterium chengjingii]QPZ38084.1 ABC transporter permease [Microbacterium chengjingii]